MQKVKVVAVCLLLIAALGLTGNAQTSTSSSAATTQEGLSGLNPAFIDKSVDPCQDFYQFACGKFSNLHPIPPDRSSFGSMSMLADENERILHSILDKAAAGGPGRAANAQKIGDYYASCLDTAAIDRKGLKPLQPELDRIAALKNKATLTPPLAHGQLINVNA